MLYKIRNVQKIKHKSDISMNKVQHFNVSHWKLSALI